MAAVEDLRCLQMKFPFIQYEYLLLTATRPVNLLHRTSILITCFNVNMPTQEEIALMVATQ